MLTINKLYNSLQKRAHWTHNIIEKGVFLNLGVMEETITDMHLLSIAEEFNGYVVTKKFSRREEGSKSGADWLWFIGEPGSWIPLLVQAKIINPKTGNCQHFDYKKGEQRKRLLLYARQHALIPIFCVYSYIPSNFIPPQYLNQPGRQKEDWACSFISPKSVRYLSSRGKKHQSDILNFGIPWMDPFYQTISNKEPIGYAIAKRIEMLRDKFEDTEVKKISSGFQTENVSSMQRRVNWENLDTIKTIKESIPRSICKIIKESSLYSANLPLAGVSIISNVPITEINELQ